MANKLSPKWQKLRNQALTRAEKLLNGLSDSDIPVPLMRIAAGLHSRVIFRPLFVEGTIAVVDGGFEIFVDASDDEVADLQKRFDDSAGAGRSLSRRLRFTIAHELAHTLFFEWMGHNQKPKSLVSATRPHELDRIERESDHFAGVLLVPDKLLTRAVVTHTIDILDPASIRDLAAEFAVSLDSLIIRLQNLVAKQSANGGIILVATDSNGPRPVRWALGGTARALFVKDYGELDMSAIANVLPQPSAFGETVRSNAWVRCKVGSRQAMQQLEIATVPPSTSSADDRLLVTVKLVGTSEPVD